MKILKRLHYFFIILFCSGCVLDMPEELIIAGKPLLKSLEWIDKNALPGRNYIIELTKDEIIKDTIFLDGQSYWEDLVCYAESKEYENGIVKKKSITITIKGDSTNRTIRFDSQGPLFVIHRRIKLVLDNNITIKGNQINNKALILIQGGTFIMNPGSNV